MSSHAANHVMRFPRPFSLHFAHGKKSKTGGVEGLGMRLGLSPSKHREAGNPQWSGTEQNRTKVI